MPDPAHHFAPHLGGEAAEAEVGRGTNTRAADELLPTLREAVEHARTGQGLSIIACPVDYSENLRLTDRLGDLPAPS